MSEIKSDEIKSEVKVAPAKKDNFIVAGWKSFKQLVVTMVVLALMGGSFYTGCWITTNELGPEHQKQVIGAAIQHAFVSTADMPVIVVNPTRSLLETAKAAIGIDVPEREVIVISTNASTRALFGKEIEPGMFETALVSVGNGAKAAWAGTKDGAAWCVDKVAFWRGEPASD